MFSDYESDLDFDTPLEEMQSPVPMALPQAGPPQMMRAPQAAPPPHQMNPPMPPPPGMGMSPTVAQQMAIQSARAQGMPFTQLGIVEEIPPAHMLGVSILLPAFGAIAGLKYDGIYGALGGSILAGSLINAYRAVKHTLQGNPDDDKEAIISGTYAVAGIGASVYLFLKAYKKRHPQAAAVNDDDDDGLRGVE